MLSAKLYNFCKVTRAARWFLHVHVCIYVEISLKHKVDSSKNNAWCATPLLHVQLHYINCGC